MFIQNLIMSRYWTTFEQVIKSSQVSIFIILYFIISADWPFSDASYDASRQRTLYDERGFVQT